MKRYISHLFVMLISVSAALITTSCTYDDDEETGTNDGNSTVTSIVTDVTLNGITYKTTEQSSYFIDPEEDALSFDAVLRSDEVEEPVLLVLYYIGWDNEDRKIKDGKELELGAVNIALLIGAGSIRGSEVTASYTEFLSGNIIAVPYEGGHGLEFNNLKFTTSYNSGQTFELDGTIYYKYTILDNPIK